MNPTGNLLVSAGNVKVVAFIVLTYSVNLSHSPVSIMRLSQATTDALFSTWLTNFSTLITASPSTYGLVTGDAVAIAAQDTAYQAALLLATDPSTRTAVTIAAKDSAKAAALFVVRPYTVAISNNAGVDDSDKTAVGATVRKTPPTPVPAPTALPLVSLLSAQPLLAFIKVVDSATPMSKQKPFGSIGVQLFSSIGTVAATDPDQLSYVKTATKLPTTLDFSSGNVGKVCSLAARYVTRGGNGGEAKVGPWSAITSFNVI